MSDYVSSRIDRSFLYLMAIYVIHGILLHMFLRPMNVNGINVDGEYVRPAVDDWRRLREKENSSYVYSGGSENLRVEGSNYGINQAMSQVSSEGRRQLLPLHKPPWSLFTTRTCAFVGSVIKNISPAAWGIISGCIVFLITFTDNVR